MRRPPGLVLAAVIFAACSGGTGDLDDLIPPSWELTSEEGHIASVCFGSREECGEVVRHYRIADERAAQDELRKQVTSAGWSFEEMPNPAKGLTFQATAENSAEGKAAGFGFAERIVYVSYLEHLGGR